MINRLIVFVLSISVVCGFSSIAISQETEEKKTGITEIYLERLGCHGKCPVDKIILRSDGTGSYIGAKYVERIGQYRSVFSKKDFYRLAEYLQAQNFSALKEEYNPQFEDAYTRAITVVQRGVIKTVTIKGDDDVPLQLWNIEMLILGVSADSDWKKDDSGIRGEAIAGPTLTFIPPGPLNNSPVPGATIIVKRAADGREVTRQRADQSGRFQIPLPADTYLIVPLPRDISQQLPRGKPQRVIVKDNVLTDIVLEYDTGAKYKPKEEK